MIIRSTEPLVKEKGGKKRRQSLSEGIQPKAGITDEKGNPTSGRSST